MTLKLLKLWKWSSLLKYSQVFVTFSLDHITQIQLSHTPHPNIILPPLITGITLNSSLSLSINLGYVRLLFKGHGVVSNNIPYHYTWYILLDTWDVLLYFYEQAKPQVNPFSLTRFCYFNCKKWLWQKTPGQLLW